MAILILGVISGNITFALSKIRLKILQYELSILITTKYNWFFVLFKYKILSGQYSFFSVKM